MLTPDEIVHRKRACIDDDGSDQATETATALVEQVVNGEAFRAVAADATREIARERPEVVAEILPRVSTWVLDGLERQDAVYRQTGVVLALDLARIDPASAGAISDLLGAAEEVGFDEWAIEAFLIAMGRRNPEFLAGELEILTDPEYEGQTVRPQRGWAIARAHRTDPTAFEPVVESLRDDLTGSTTDQQAALERLGQLGLVAPEMVESAVPEIVALADADDEQLRSAAVSALGRIAGTETWTDAPFGVPWDGADTDLFETITKTLDASAQSVVAAAATSLARAAAHRGDRRERAIERLLDRLSTADAESVRVALLQALQRLTEAETIDPNAVDLLTAAAAPAQPIDERKAALRVLGRIAPGSTAEASIEQALAEGARADATAVQREAIDAIADRLGRRDEPSPELRKTLVSATRDDDRLVREDAFEALARAGDTAGVRASLIGRLDDPDSAEMVAETACRLEAAPVVEVLVDRFVGAFESFQADEAADGPTPYSSDAHLTDRQKALLDGLVVVAREYPTSISPSVERLVDVLIDEDTPETHNLPRALAAVAAADPGAVRPFAASLGGQLLGEGRQPDAGFLLDALLAVGAVDDRMIERVIGDYEAKALAPAVVRLASLRPLFALRIATELEHEIRAVDDHFAVNWWIHELGELGSADVRVAPLTMELCRLALEAGDDWVRWDGAEAFAVIAADHPRWVRSYVPELIEALDDWNSHVPEWSLRALGRVGDGTVRSAIEPFTAHPRTEVRNAAETAGQRLDAPGDEGGSDDGLEDVFEYPSTGRKRARTTLRKTAAQAPDRFLARCVVAAREADARTRVRIRELLVEVTDGDGSAIDPPAAFVDWLDAADPLERAMAAYGVGATADETTADPAALIDALGAHLDDEEPLVRQWVIRSVGVVGAISPETVRPHIGALAGRLDDEDPTTRAHIVGAFDRLATVDPDLLTDAVEALTRRLTDPVDFVRLEAVSVLKYAPPEAIASVPGASRRLVNFLQDEDSGRAQEDAATALGSLATADAEALAGELDRLMAELGRRSIRAAVAAVAAEYPEAVREYETELADRSDEPHTREALARLYSPDYPDHLREAIRNRSETPLTELDTVVDYAVSAPRRERREAVIDAIGPAIRGNPSRTAAVLGALTEKLADPEAAVRQHAAFSIAEAVGKLDPDDATVLETTVLSALLDCAGDGSWAVRSEAYRAIEAVLAAGGAGIEEYETVVGVAVAGLGDEHGHVRRRAAEILDRLPADVRETFDVENRVLTLLEAGDSLEQRGSILAVGKLGETDGIPTSTSEWEVVGGGSEANGPDGSPIRALEALEDAFAASDLWARRNALESVTTIVAAHDAATVERLLAAVSYPVRERVREGLSDRNPVVRAEACRCLGFIGTVEDEPSIAALASDDESQPRVRAEASAALERLRERIPEAGAG
ncbi:HEAT repeat domain-containing protein [Halobellus ordinarius]|uniref:HEAT repeat domain-containing protein n=1 Tax=Halobellus ordinarius TaxID=3075120 RepID=UPI002880A504|nr:HEAT repeat domain-containing protein [Halobellus sp. ZY16]